MLYSGRIPFTGNKKLIHTRAVIRSLHFNQRLLGNLETGRHSCTSIDREGSWQGFDLELVQSVADAVSIPVIAHGGGGKLEHIVDVVKQAHASAVGLGSMVVFQKEGMGVLVNFPDHSTLEKALQ